MPKNRRYLALNDAFWAQKAVFNYKQQFHYVGVA